MLLMCRQTREANMIWLSNGGNATLDSYKAKTLGDIPDDHWSFFEECVDFYDHKDFFCVHAYANPALPLTAQDWSTARWTHLKEGRVPSGYPKPMICGHTPQLDGVPRYYSDEVWCIDTGSFKTGWLTCFEPETKSYWQVNEWGGRRSSD
jgi:serine/threonine protein phosphatase 1